MSIYRFLYEARRLTESCSDAAELRRLLRGLPQEYRQHSSVRESLAGYTVGEERLIGVRNAAALATISKSPDFRDAILAKIDEHMAEATRFLGPRATRSNDARYRGMPALDGQIDLNDVPLDVPRWRDSARDAR